MNMPIPVTLESRATTHVNDPEHRWVAVCMGTGCTSSASMEVGEALRAELAKNGLLSEGRNLAKVDLSLIPTGTPTSVEVDERLLAFEELMISKARKDDQND